MPRLRKTKLSRIAKREVPDTFHREVSRALSVYCVALARMTNGDGETFHVFGSGTLVVRDGVHGVLTAYHCLHSPEHDVKLGNTGPDRIYFISQSGKMPHAAQHELREHALGIPHRRSSGPDLAFIEIPPGPTLSALKAIGSFRRLNRDVKELRAKFCVERMYIANLGYPEFRNEEIKRTKKEVRANVTLMAGAGSLRWEDLSRRGAWDYIRCPIDFRAYPHLHRNYKGMSGGGIWAVLLDKDKGEFVIKDYALLGVTFYQTPLRYGRRFLRGHFVDSIHERAWRNWRR